MSQFPKKDRYSITEVGTLVESMRNDISLIAEGQVALRSDVKILKTDVKELKADMTIVKDVIQVAIPDIYRRLSTLEAKVS